MRKYDTHQRSILINFLNEHPDEQFSARQIADLLAAQQISPSAVYRNLLQLELAGLVQKTTKPGAREAYFQYRGTPACQTHLHLSCVRCGKTVHMSLEHTLWLQQELDQKEGFCLNIPATVLYGICQNCQG